MKLRFENESVLNRSVVGTQSDFEKFKTLLSKKNQEAE
jgi:hypothetical protein